MDLTDYHAKLLAYELTRRSPYLKELCDIGVLREVKAGREKLFIHPNLIALLNADDHKVPEYHV